MGELPGQVNHESDEAINTDDAMSAQMKAELEQLRPVLEDNLKQVVVMNDLIRQDIAERRWGNDEELADKLSELLLKNVPPEMDYGGKDELGIGSASEPLKPPAAEALEQVDRTAREALELLMGKAWGSPELQAVDLAVRSITQIDVDELGNPSFTPGRLVALTLEAVATLLGEEPANEWSTAQAMLADEHFLRRIRNFDKDNIQAGRLEKLKALVTADDFNPEKLSLVSAAASKLCFWCDCIFFYGISSKEGPTWGRVEVAVEVQETRSKTMSANERLEAAKEETVQLDLQRRTIGAVNGGLLQDMVADMDEADPLKRSAKTSAWKRWVRFNDSSLPDAANKWNIPTPRVKLVSMLLELAKIPEQRRLLLNDVFGAQLCCAALSKAQLGKANLRGASLVRADLTNANLQGATLDGANLYRAKLESAQAQQLQPDDASKLGYTYKQPQPTTLVGANMEETILKHADMELANLAGATLTRAQMNFVQLRGAVLVDADLTGADLRSAILKESAQPTAITGPHARTGSHANLKGATLAGANFTEADLTGACMEDVIGDLPDFGKLSLILSGANLTRASLVGANLTNATFTSVQNRFTNVEVRTILVGAQLVNTLLQSAIDLEQAQFDPMPTAATSAQGSSKSHTRAWLCHQVLCAGESNENEGADDEFDIEAGDADAEPEEEEEPEEIVMEPPASVDDLMLQIEDLAKSQVQRIKESVASTTDHVAAKASETIVQRLAKGESGARKVIERKVAQVQQRAAEAKQKATAQLAVSEKAARAKVAYVLSTADLEAQARSCIADEDLSAIKERLTVFLEQANQLERTAKAISSIDSGSTDQTRKHIEAQFSAVEEELHGSMQKWKREQLDNLKAFKEEVVQPQAIKEALASVTSYDMRGIIRPWGKALSMNPIDLQEDTKELEHLSTELEGLREAIAITTWDDTFDTWLSVSRLRGELRGERSREILRQIFDNQELCDALGMAYQLQDIRREAPGGVNAIPEGLLKQLKHECGAHIKRNYFTYKQAINKEVANISRIQQKQHQIVASLNAVLTGVCVAVFTKASQSLFPASQSH